MDDVFAHDNYMEEVGIKSATYPHICSRTTLRIKYERSTVQLFSHRLLARIDIFCQTRISV